MTPENRSRDNRCRPCWEHAL